MTMALLSKERLMSMTICCKEFKDRVSQKRNILPHRTLSDALKNFAVTVSPAEEEEKE
jgi:hypothetical protein